MDFNEIIYQKMVNNKSSSLELIENIALSDYMVTLYNIFSIFFLNYLACQRFNKTVFKM